MIDNLNNTPKQDNALQVARTADIPSNEKYTAAEWNAIVNKINEIITDLDLGQITDSVTKTTASNLVRLVEGALIENQLTIRNLPSATTEEKMLLLNSLGEAALADINDYIKKLEVSDPEAQYVVLADGTRIDPNTLIEEKEIVAYNALNPRPAIGEVGKLYIDTDTDNGYLWNELTQDYVGIGIIDLSNYYNKTETNNLLDGKLEVDMSNLASDLDEIEQDDIKTKLNIDEGELKKIGNGYGLQHQIDNPTYYGTLGNKAINLSNSQYVGNYGATGGYSHAEGRNTKASGTSSHAEGSGTTASGSQSNARGYNTTASGGSSSAEGSYTTASGTSSHAEGSGTTAGSFAENARGIYNEIITPISVDAFNPNDVVESVGVGTNSVRKNALTRWKNGAFKWLLQPLTNITNAVLGFHAADEDGRLNYYDGTDWNKYLIEGEGGSGGELKKIGDGYGLQHQIDNPNNYGTLGLNAVNLSYSGAVDDFGATGDFSISEGRDTIASGDYSHAEGFETTASGASSHTQGTYTVASGANSHAEGGNTIAGSFAENARGNFNEIITPVSATSFDLTDVIESVGVGENPAGRKNALTRWKNGAFKWLLQPLTNITNAVIGFHAADENGRLNYHDGTAWKKYALEGEGGGGAGNGVTPTVTASVVTSYDIDPQTATEHWNLAMTGDTDFDFTNMFASGNSKVITITLEGAYAFTFPSWLKPLATNDNYDTMGGTLAAEIVINIKNGGATPSGYYSLQMIDYAL